MEKNDILPSAPPQIQAFAYVVDPRQVYATTYNDKYCRRIKNKRI